MLEEILPQRKSLPGNVCYIDAREKRIRFGRRTAQIFHLHHYKTARIWVDPVVPSAYLQFFPDDRGAYRLMKQGQSVQLACAGLINRFSLQSGYYILGRDKETAMLIIYLKRAYKGIPFVEEKDTLGTEGDDGKGCN